MLLRWQTWLRSRPRWLILHQWTSLGGFLRRKWFEKTKEGKSEEFSAFVAQRWFWGEVDEVHSICLRLVHDG
jgi:hypothetical protein